MRKYSVRRMMAVLLGIMVCVVQLNAKEVSEIRSLSRKDVAFNEMVYEHIDYEIVVDKIKAVYPIMIKGDQVAFNQWEGDYYELFQRLQSMAQLAFINSRLYVDEITYFEEYLYSSELLNVMRISYLALFEGSESEQVQSKTSYLDLVTQRVELINQYYNLSEGIMVYVQGREQTIDEVLGSAQLTVREKLVYYDEWYDQLNMKAAELLGELVVGDNEMARLAGYDSFVEYMYDSYRRSYSAEESRAFFEYVKVRVAPVLKELSSSLNKEIHKLEAWSCESVEMMLEQVGEGFIQYYPPLKEAYDYLLTYQLYDAEPRSNKVQGASTVYLYGVNQPFMMLNYEKDYQTLLAFIHEMGHYYALFVQGMIDNSLDISETYSQGLEVLALKYYSEIMQDKEVSEGMALYTLANMIQAILEGCLYEEWMQIIYENPELTVGQMNDLFAKLALEYGLSVDRRSWSEVSHNFETPFYYLSYSVSGVMALQIWEQSLTDYDLAMDNYLTMIALGDEGRLYNQDLGLNNPLSQETIDCVMSAVEAYMGNKRMQQVA